jgi:hypothetical protein
MHSVFSKSVRSGKYSLKLMWTPKEGIEWLQRQPSAIKVGTGEKYEFTGWLKTKDATGESYFSIHLYDGIDLKKTIKSDIFSGTSDWKRVSFEFPIPDGVDRIRLGCCSDANNGAVWFDDVEIIRLGE